jgi:hypothetical protein
MENGWMNRVTELETAMQEIIAAITPEMSTLRNTDPIMIVVLEIAVKAIDRKGE